MFNDLLHPIFAFAILIFAFGIGSVLERIFPTLNDIGRVSTLDGLRGFLVIAVFIGHASVWYFYLKTGVWRLPPSNFYGNLGQVSVAFFFMITGFLFYSKLLRAKGQRIDWVRIFTSRILRLAPLYLVMLVVLLTVVSIESDFDLIDSPKSLIRNVLSWIPFGLWGMPDINGVEQTANIVASVLWTLPYEWLFYLALPILAIFAGVKLTRMALALAIVMISFVVWRMQFPGPIHLSIFLGGIIAAYCERSALIRKLCSGKVASFLALTCLTVVMFVFPSAYASGPIVLLSIIFIIIACGNSIFGVLIHRGVRFVGDMGYSVYLLHGIFLYVTFNYISTSNVILQQGPIYFWGIVTALTVPLIFICYITFRFVELPAMAAVSTVTRLILINYQRARRISAGLFSMSHT